MTPSVKLALVMDQIKDLEEYIDRLVKDGTINHYTAGSAKIKIDRCKQIEKI